MVDRVQLLRLLNREDDIGEVAGCDVFLATSAVAACASSSSSSSSDNAESRLDESSGTGMSVVAAFGLLEKGVREDRACFDGLQQNVSRFHNRHERFSRRLPSSMACEVLENSDHCGVH